MPSNPPTRRSRRTPSGEPSLPIIPILIGVIVLGFVIGAGLSLAGRHDMTVVALASPSAAASETLAPVTPAPSEKPTPEPTAAPAQQSGAPAASETATPVPVVVTTPRARLAQRATPVAIVARATPVRSAAVVAAASPVAEAVHSVNASTESAASPVAATGNASVASSGKSPAASNADIVQADSAFAKLSAAVVRQYIEAVKRGDQDGAYAALGTTAGAKGATLTEEGVVDSQTRVGRIDARAAANDNALVSVQLQTPSGAYFGQYTVHKTDTGAAVIVAHSIVKP